MLGRELTPIEQAMEVLSREAGAFNLVIISGGPLNLTPSVVNQALAQAQQRHPRLADRVTGSLEKLCFGEHDRSPIALKVLESKSPEDWQRIVSVELNQPLQSENLRAVLMQGETCYLITTLHPAIADKIAGTQLHLEILSDCQTLLSGQPLPPVSPGAVMPTLNELLPESMRGSRGVERAILYLLRTQAQLTWKRPATLPFEDSAPIQARRCGLVHRELAAAVTESLVEVCQTKSIPLRDAVCAAMLLAVARQLTPQNAKSVRLSCQSYLNLRSHFQPPVEASSMGVLESAVMSFHTIKPKTSFWDLAGSVKKQLENTIKQGHIFSVAILFRKIVEVFLKTPETAPATVAVNYLDLPENQPAHLSRLNFAVGQKVYGGIFSVAVCRFQQRLFLNFVYSEPSLSTATVQQLADQVVSRLTQVSQLEPALASIESV